MLHSFSFTFLAWWHNPIIYVFLHNKDIPSLTYLELGLTGFAPFWISSSRNYLFSPLSSYLLGISRGRSFHSRLLLDVMRDDIMRRTILFFQTASGHARLPTLDKRTVFAVYVAILIWRRQWDGVTPKADEVSEDMIQPNADKGPRVRGCHISIVLLGHALKHKSCWSSLPDSRPYLRNCVHVRAWCWGLETAFFVHCV